MSFFFKTAAIASVPIIFVRILSGKSTTVTYYVRLTLYLTSMTAVATCAAFVALTMSLVGKRYDVNWVISKAFYGVTSTLLDVHVEIEGEEHLETKPAVVMMNHQSMLDILFFGKYVYCLCLLLAKNMNCPFPLEQ
jgi:lysophosphatidate acyltransferase